MCGNGRVDATEDASAGSATGEGREGGSGGSGISGTGSAGHEVIPEPEGSLTRAGGVAAGGAGQVAPGTNEGWGATPSVRSGGGGVEWSGVGGESVDGIPPVRYPGGIPGETGVAGEAGTVGAAGGAVIGDGAVGHAVSRGSGVVTGSGAPAGEGATSCAGLALGGVCVGGAKGQEYVMGLLLVGSDPEPTCSLSATAPPVVD